ncbi:hypothetical protein GYMLUDRAFT_244514 [Collybiopsis luxurians FD-317 M1]|uniref:Unplaced genomic scaffold GYMLUscaffold_27, whole genome shotgun sequence n=1 Tax=Collybiopsis luxurians FD-317 M1 TaxID=944289 RepID=A0A0D0CWN8_9AGAR|nr:hypothetical protein GYMLUDRAFT_244514 [Collybiopsis luxurians FD-317 M1]
MPALCDCTVSQDILPCSSAPSTTTPGCNCGQLHLTVPPPHTRTEEEAQLCINILLQLPNAEWLHKITTMDDEQGDGDNEKEENEQLELTSMDINSSSNNKYDFLVTDEDNVISDCKEKVKFEVTSPSPNDDSKQDQLFLVTLNDGSIIWEDNRMNKGTKILINAPSPQLTTCVDGNASGKFATKSKSTGQESRSITPLSLPTLHSILSTSAYLTESSMSILFSPDSTSNPDAPYIYAKQHDSASIKHGEKCTLDSPMPECLGKQNWGVST